MRRLGFFVALVFAASVAYGLAHLALIEIGREVIVLRTRTSDGDWRDTRLWVIDDGGFEWVNGGGVPRAIYKGWVDPEKCFHVGMRGFGVDVVVIEPGAIATRWIDTAEGQLASHRGAEGPYAALERAVPEQLRGGHAGLLRLAAGRPEDVARVIERAISATRPRTRYVVPALSGLFIALRRFLPDRVWDALMRRMYLSPGA